MLTSTVSPRWVYAEWVKLDFRISGFVAIVIVALKVVLLIYGSSMSRFGFLLLDYTKTFLLGVPLGLIALFVPSGELAKGVQAAGGLWSGSKS